MRYALNISDNNRILSVTYEKYSTEGMPIVETLPDGNISDYLYVNGEYVYDPLPIPPIPYDPTADEILDVLLGVSK